jgi:excisionase family DNA binding protein
MFHDTHTSKEKSSMTPLSFAQRSESPSLFSGQRLLTAQDVAERLGVSERWVRDHATRRTPRIPVVKLGPLLRFRAEDIEKFLHCQLVSTSSKTAQDGV